MASWLKAAEDLFEVVDRRAKLVVNELADEQSSSSQSAVAHDSNKQGYQAKRTKLKKAGQRRLSMNDFSSKSDNVLEHTNIQTSQSDMEPDKEDRAPPIVANEVNPSGNSVGQSINEQQYDIDREAPMVGTTLSETLTDDVVKTESEHVEAAAMGAHVEIIRSTLNGNLASDNASDVSEEQPSSPSSVKGAEVVSENHQVDTGSNIQVEDAGVSMKVDQEASEPVVTKTPSHSETQQKDDDVRVEPMVNQKKQQEHKVDISIMKESPMKGKDQLDEAQGLLKTTSSTGQSKEARLARVCAGLSSRLQEYKSENAQLEELLTAERELSKSYEAHINQLQQDLSASKLELTRVESSMVEALAVKNSEIETLVSSMDALKKQSALSEGNLASLQANMESIMRNRELTETRMMQALREELASTERRAEEERAAHNATKMASMEREVELEHRAVETSTALARIQRIADERTAKTAELEQKVALLEVECSSLNQELQDMETRARRGQKKSVDEANQSIQMQAWQDEVERARRGQRDAESKLSYVEAEVQKMRVEMAAMKRDAEHYSRQEHMELEKRYRELTDLLYLKQTQLENMASEKAALEFQLDKEIKRLQEAQVEAERSRITRRVASTSWEEDAEMKALEPLPLHHRHMAGASIQLQKAAKFLDSGAVRATRFLWRYPIARLLLLFYLVFVHLFLMYLLHRLQEQDDSFAAREVAESMGLANRTLKTFPVELFESHICFHYQIVYLLFIYNDTSHVVHLNFY